MTQTLRKTEERIEGATGLNLFVRSWRPEGAVRGVVVIIPGFNAHSGYYAWAGEQLAADGLAVYAVDLRGRGQSDGERFYVDTFADYVSDAGSSRESREVEGVWVPRISHGPQRGRRRLMSLCARPPKRIGGTDL